MAETKDQEPKEKENLYSAESLGSGAFNITKPKRKPRKLRQSRVKKPQRQARK